MKNKKLVIVIIFCWVALFIGFSIDDELDQEVKDLISDFEDKRESTSDAYIYLSGIASLKEKNIVEYGTYNLSVSQYQEINSSPLSKSKTFKTLDSKVPKEDSSFYCKVWKEGCLNKIVSSASAWEVELDYRNILLDRYKTYLSYTDYSTLTSPNESEVYPNYKYLFYGNRLLTFKNLLLADRKNPAIAIDNLAQNIRMLRSQLIKADNLLFKLTLASLISESLDIISHIKIMYKPNIIISIDSLSNEERSLRNVWTREFVFVHKIFKNADKNSELFEIGGNAYPWFVRLSYKPNMTVNDHHPLYNELMDLSELNLPEFAINKLKIRERTSEYPNLRNIFGYFLFKLGLETQEILYGYIGRVNDLDAKISLVNYILGNGSLINPYYPTIEAGFIKGGKLCLKGPLVDNRIFRCVRTQY